MILSVWKMNFQRRLGTDISINHKQSGKGSINFKYTNLDDLERIIANWK